MGVRVKERRKKYRRRELVLTRVLFPQIRIPFGLATTLGLAAVALGVDLTPAQVGAGLPAPAAAQALLGKGGAVAMLLLLL